MNFESLFWLEKPWQELVRRANSKHLPHALMLTGQKNIGKMEFAQHLAQWLLCLSPDKHTQGKPCTQCHSCNLLKAGNHPDYIYVKPEGKSNQILIGQIREANQLLTETPSISEQQVLIIHPADVMNLNASNAFLKTLEEPPGQAQIILLSNYYGAMMPTIKSRTQKINLLAPSLADAQRWLYDKGYAQEQENRLALIQNNGAPLGALECLERSGVQAERDWEQGFIAWMSQNKSLSDMVGSWDKWELSMLLSLLYRYLLNWAKYHLGVKLDATLSQALRELFESRTLCQNKVNQLQKRLLDLSAFTHAGVGSHNKTLLLESILLELQSICIVKKEIST